MLSRRLDSSNCFIHRCPRRPLRPAAQKTSKPLQLRLGASHHLHSPDPPFCAPSHLRRRDSAQLVDREPVGVASLCINRIPVRRQIALASTKCTPNRIRACVACCSAGRRRRLQGCGATSGAGNSAHARDNVSPAGADPRRLHSPSPAPPARARRPSAPGRMAAWKAHPARSAATTSWRRAGQWRSARIVSERLHPCCESPEMSTEPSDRGIWRRGVTWVANWLAMAMRRPGWGGLVRWVGDGLW